MAIILKKRGSPYGVKVPENKFSREAIGEAKPLVRNGLNQREYKNRRVEIIFY